MDALRSEWCVVLLNALLIALICTLPILVALFGIRALRKAVSDDRKQFEEKVETRLDGIAASLDEIREWIETKLPR